MSDELKACPFCGDALTAQEHPRRRATDHNIQIYQHPQGNCHLAGYQLNYAERELWNRRSAREGAVRDGPNQRTMDALLPEGLHPHTKGLVFRFACALADKLYAAEQKYSYADGWADPNWLDECRAKLREHVEKGDPRDVAAYCAFLWHHGASTAAPPSGEIQQTGWVRVSERLPNDGDMVFVYNGSMATVANYSADPDEGGPWTDRVQGCAQIEDEDEVTHWMPLPTPPASDGPT